MSRFVLYGEGDPEVAVKAQGFWTWATEEVLALILWLREWNVSHPDHPVDVTGIDAQEGRTATGELSAFLQRTDASFAENVWSHVGRRWGDHPASE